MCKILIFGGTTEGRVLAERLLKHNIDVTVSVATESGKEVLKKDIKCLVNRLNKDEMKSLIKEYNLIIDATHPYAVEATENISLACIEESKEYIRLIRKEETAENAIYVKDIAEAIEYLNSVEENILLTTGSRDLHMFLKIKDFNERVYARVLPTIDVLKKCNELGLKTKNIIAMQGPFTKETNIAILKQINAKYMVTKESGKVGGFREKVEAAALANAKLIVIGRPLNENGFTLDKIERKIIKDFNIDIKEEYTRYFPLFINLNGKTVRVFGAGVIATRRIKTLLDFNCNIEVISPSASEEIKALSKENRIKHIKREYSIGDCREASLVLAATNNREANHSIYLECKEKNILCSIADSKDECSFYFPGVVCSENIVVGVTASGKSHRAAKIATEKVRNLFKEEDYNG